MEEDRVKDYNHNSYDQLREFFSGEEVCGMLEFMQFWNSLTWEEKLYFRRAPLT